MSSDGTKMELDAETSAQHVCKKCGTLIMRGYNWGAALRMGPMWAGVVTCGCGTFKVSPYSA